MKRLPRRSMLKKRYWGTLIRAFSFARTFNAGEERQNGSKASALRCSCVFNAGNATRELRSELHPLHARQCRSDVTMMPSALRCPGVFNARDAMGRIQNDDAPSIRTRRPRSLPRPQLSQLPTRPPARDYISGVVRLRSQTHLGSNSFAPKLPSEHGSLSHHGVK